MLQGLNWLAIAVAGVFNWLFGWLWFGPLLGDVFRQIVPGADSEYFKREEAQFRALMEDVGLAKK